MCLQLTNYNIFFVIVNRKDDVQSSLITNHMSNTHIINADTNSISVLLVPQY